MEKDAAGVRRATCKNRDCVNYRKEFMVPTAELVMRLLKSSEGENEK
jgi:hypothetical protein